MHHKGARGICEGAGDAEGSIESTCASREEERCATKAEQQRGDGMAKALCWPWPLVLLAISTSIWL